MPTVAILAGGFASRLGELTRQTPKSLLEVAGRPFIFHQLEVLVRQGVRDVVLCLGHLGDLIQTAVGDGRSLGLRVRYSWDGGRPLGTGGAIRAALPLLGDDFLLLYGDSYLQCDFRKVAAALRQSSYAALMTLLRNEDRWDRSNVVFRDGLVVRYDKSRPTAGMRYIDYGLSGFRRAAFERYILKEPLDLSDVYCHLVARAGLGGYVVTRRFFEIGTPSGLEETRRYLSGVRGRTGCNSGLEARE